MDWDPVWSPDGRYLYFSSNRSGSMNIWRVPIEESSGRVLGGVEPVTTPSLYSGDLSFSRDGSVFAYADRIYSEELQTLGFAVLRPVGRRVAAFDSAARTTSVFEPAVPWNEQSPQLL